jgi:hypothetical protein
MVLPMSWPMRHLPRRRPPPVPAGRTTAQALQPVQPLGPRPAWTLCRPKGQCPRYCLHPCTLPRATAVKGPGHRVVPTYLVNLKLEKLEILNMSHCTHSHGCDSGSRYMRCKTLAPRLVGLIHRIAWEAAGHIRAHLS